MDQIVPSCRVRIPKSKVKFTNDVILATMSRVLRKCGQ